MNLIENSTKIKSKITSLLYQYTLKVTVLLTFFVRAPKILLIWPKSFYTMPPIISFAVTIPVVEKQCCL